MDNKEKFNSLDSTKFTWPFKNMKVGDVVVFTGEQTKLAAINAHTYGRYLGFKFKTRTDRKTRDVYVKRIA